MYIQKSYGQLSAVRTLIRSLFIVTNIGSTAGTSHLLTYENSM